MKILLGLAVGTWLGYYIATGRHIWDDYQIAFTVLTENS